MLRDKKDTTLGLKPVPLAILALTACKYLINEHDAYNTGDKCTYQGKKYISKINGNTTIPGSDNRYWEEVV